MPFHDVIERTAVVPLNFALVAFANICQVCVALTFQRRCQHRQNAGSGHVDCKRTVAKVVRGRFERVEPGMGVVVVL